MHYDIYMLHLIINSSFNRFLDFFSYILTIVTSATVDMNVQTYF